MTGSEELRAVDGDPQVMGRRAAAQFFVGGAVLFVAALTLTSALTTSYDGVISLLVYGFGAVIIAVGSIVLALIVGLPLRLVDGLRSRWLANGELTLAGAVIGLTACWLLVMSAPTRYVADDLGGYEVREPVWWAVLCAWALFALSVAHFVWPRRWRRSGASAPFFSSPGS